MNIDYRKTLSWVKHLAITTLRGLVRTIYGALIAGLIGISLYGFIAIEAETGYIAVFDFVASCATLMVAVCNLYVMGGKKHGKRAK
jgi:hypothetical protein